MTPANNPSMQWERVAPPLWWPAAQMYVMADRHLPDGTRQHMVPGHVKPGLVIANAEVIGASDVPDADFSDSLSSLSVALTAQLGEAAIPDEDLIDGTWYLVHYERHGSVYRVPALYRKNASAFYSHEFTGIPARWLKVVRQIDTN